jgi:hypothetical protein
MTELLTLLSPYVLVLFFTGRWQLLLHPQQMNMAAREAQSLPPFTLKVKEEDVADKR